MKRALPHTHKGVEGCNNLAAGAGAEDLDLQPHGARSRFYVSQRGLGRWTVWIDEYSHASSLGYQFTQEFQPLCGQLTTEKIDSCQIAARPGKAGDKTLPDRVFRGHEDDGDCRGGRPGRKLGTSGRGDHRDLPANQFGRQRRQPLHLVLSPAVFDRDVLALDVAGLLEALAERPQAIRISVRRLAVEETDHRHRRLLRVRRERPRRRAAEYEYEFSPSDVGCHVTLPWRSCPCNGGDDITL